MTPVGVVVLGMGRSGTSAVTRMFVEAGFFAGEEHDLLAADDGNPRGHFENLHVLHLNERVLHRLGGWWYDPPTRTAQLEAAAWARPLLETELERRIDEARPRPLVLKDPRIGSLFTLWQPILQGRIHPVFVIRDPVAIAKSLFTRDATPLPFGLAMWELTTTFMLGHLQGTLVTVVRHEALLDSPPLARQIVSHAAAHLDSELTRSIRPELGSRALDRSLLRSQVLETDYEEVLSARQHELWRWLRSLAAGDQRIDAPAGLREPTANIRALVRAEEERALTQVELTKARELVAAAKAAAG